MDTKNLKRQIRDVISQSDQLKSSQNFETDFKNYANYVKEMIEYIKTVSSDKMILDRIYKLPVLKYKKMNSSILLLPILPYYLGVILKNNIEKQKALKKTAEVSSIFSSIEFLLVPYF